MKIALDWALPAACVAVIIGLPLLWRPPRSTRQLRREYQQAVREVGEDTLDMLARAARDWPHESYAWGAASRERIATPFRHDCGCRLGSDVRGERYWQPCEAHEREDGDFALWKAELEDQR